MFFAERCSDLKTQYGVLCSPTTEIQKACRAFIEQLFQNNRDYVGTDLPSNARRQLGKAFWELYVAQALRLHGVHLVPRTKRPKAGPDFMIGQPRVWVEAIAPGPGTGADQVHEPPLDGHARKVPDDQIQLRYMCAIDEKRKKLDRYRAQGIVGSDDPCVIALNGAEVSSSGDFDPPRIIRMLFGIGWPVAHICRTSGQVTSWSHESRAAVSKASGATVPATGFLDGSLAGIAAILFSLATPWNSFDHRPGCDFMLIHNPDAKTKVPIGLLPAHREYRLDAGRLVVSEAYTA